MEWKPGYVNKQTSLMQMYYKSCVHSRTIKVHELLCCINGYAMRIEGKKFEFEDTIVWVFVMHSSVEWLQKGCICKLTPKKKARFFSLMYFCESLCINRISHNYVIPQFLFCIIMPFRTSFHIPFRKLFLPFTLTGSKIASKPQTTVSYRRFEFKFLDVKIAKFSRVLALLKRFLKSQPSMQNI